MRLMLALTFGIAFAISVVAVLAVRKIALAVGFVDYPGGRKKHPEPVPLGGGLAILLGTCLPLLAVGLLSYLAGRQADLIGMLPAVLAPSVKLASARLPLLLGVLGGGVAVAALGLWDDVKDLGPWPKLLGQILIAGAVSLIPQARITLFIELPWAQVLVTTAWIVLMMNASNLLDNMDGQSGLVAFLTGGTLLVLALQTGQFFIAGMLLALLGAVLGFLVFNLPPASVFMGDTGSMFIGYVLAVATTLATFVAGRQVNPFFPMLVPLVIFAVPLYDTFSVVAIRIHKGRPLTQGDRSHFSHRLMRLGMNDRMVLMTVSLLVVATSPGATIPYGSPTWRVFVPALQALAVLAVIVMLEMTSLRSSDSR